MANLVSNGIITQENALQTENQDFHNILIMEILILLFINV
ncbi:hypothetical protein SBF1_1010026 [Candidatus Desulfosporosinus infrequens]|uniref:Uncharacterized protein n=1 Tax=Candidatus Desulfosporosinus infrequens TaxID=2043169 RepID=A0A2U3JW01_9FIRM|nr:hypothetical protein SBF1_1010026 [Candidatus Desulfosporosinus infrequens]